MLNNFSSILFEGRSQTASDWAESLGIDIPAVHNLISQGVFQRVRSGRLVSLRLNMVGIISTRERVFFCAPKIFKEENINFNSCIKRTILTIQTYHRHIKRGPDVATAGDADIYLEGGLILDQFMGLLAWTRDFGIHGEDHYSKDDGYKNIDWRLTIQNKLAIHKGGLSFYPDPVGMKTSRSLSDLGVLQSIALKEIKGKLGPISGAWSNEHDTVWDDCDNAISDAWDTPTDSKSISAILERFDSICTTDNDKELLELLKGYFSDTFSKNSTPILYGVSSFHTVWEHMCLSAFSEKVDQERHELIASQPQYIIDDIILKTDPQRPDILLSRVGKIMICDAKWYKAESMELPGTPDAVKQFFYSESLTLGREVFCNIFLLPALNSTPWMRLGSLRMSFNGNEDSRFHPVHLIGLDWTYLSGIYGNGKKLPADFFTWLSAIPSSEAMKKEVP